MKGKNEMKKNTLKTLALTLTLVLIFGCIGSLPIFAETEEAAAEAAVPEGFAVCADVVVEAASEIPLISAGARIARTFVI